MKAQWTAGFLSLVALIGLVTPSSAFDGHRKGFILGLGIGPGFTHASHDLSSAYSDSFFIFGPSLDLLQEKSTATLATDFRIGYGFTDHLLIYYDNKVSWFGTGDGWLSDGLTSAALSYYLQAEHPSLYGTAGVGRAGWGKLYQEGGSAGYTGLGFFGGVGYEMSERFGLEGTIAYGMPKDESDPVFWVHTTCLSLRAHLIVQWY